MGLRLMTAAAAAIFVVGTSGAVAEMAPMPMHGTLPVGTTITWKATSSDRPEEIRTARVLSGDTDFLTVSITREDGGVLCDSMTFDLTAYPYADSKWEGCTYGKGARKLKKKSGELWPLAVGNTMVINVDAWSTNPERGNRLNKWAFDSTCSVAAMERISVPAGEFDTYKVVCDDQADTRTWWFSPGADFYVKYHQVWKRLGGRTDTQEMVSIQTP